MYSQWIQYWGLCGRNSRHKTVWNLFGNFLTHESTNLTQPRHKHPPTNMIFDKTQVLPIFLDLYTVFFLTLHSGISSHRIRKTKRNVFPRNPQTRGEVKGALLRETSIIRQCDLIHNLVQVFSTASDVTHSSKSTKNGNWETECELIIFVVILNLRFVFI